MKLENSSATKVALRGYGEPHGEWSEVAFHMDPAACGHIESMCVACYDQWEVDHHVALPAIFRNFIGAASAALGRHDLMFTF